MSAVYCRRCLALTASSKDFCPHCGAADPAGRVNDLAGAAFLATLGGAAAAGCFAWAVTDRWDRWEKKFADLDPGHPLSGEASAVAVGVGILAFLVGWVVAFVGVRNRCRQAVAYPRPAALPRPRARHIRLAALSAAVAGVATAAYLVAAAVVSAARLEPTGAGAVLAGAFAVAVGAVWAYFLFRPRPGSRRRGGRG